MPDVKIRPQEYKDPRPFEELERYYRYAQGKHSFWVYYLVWIILAPFCYIVFRLRVYDRRNIPSAGSLILAPNHFSNMDHFFMAAYIRRKVRFMAKSQMFKPHLDKVYRLGGVFPVRRGHNDEESLLTAISIASTNGTVAMYCQGGRSRTGDIFENDAKRGIGRVVLESGTPVTPIAIHGAEKARNWRRGEFPVIRVKYGEAMNFPHIENPTLTEQQKVADRILVEIRRLYFELDEKIKNQHPLKTAWQKFGRWSIAFAVVVATIFTFFV